MTRSGTLRVALSGLVRNVDGHGDLGWAWRPGTLEQLQLALEAEREHSSFDSTQEQLIRLAAALRSCSEESADALLAVLSWVDRPDPAVTIRSFDPTARAFSPRARAHDGQPALSPDAVPLTSLFPPQDRDRIWARLHARKEAKHVPPRHLTGQERR